MKVKEVMSCDLLHASMFLIIFVSRFMSVLVCLVFSVLSTIEEYKGFANETLFWMVRPSIQQIILGQAFETKFRITITPIFPIILGQTCRVTILNQFSKIDQNVFYKSLLLFWKCILKEMWAEKASIECKVLSCEYFVGNLFGGIFWSGVSCATLVCRLQVEL